MALVLSCGLHRKHPALPCRGKSLAATSKNARFPEASVVNLLKLRSQKMVEKDFSRVPCKDLLNLGRQDARKNYLEPSRKTTGFSLPHLQMARRRTAGTDDHVAAQSR